MLKVGTFTGFTVGFDPEVIRQSVDRLNADIVRIHDALAPKCGKTFTVKFDSNPMYGCTRYLQIVATGKDITTHILPYLRDEECMWDKGEDWWLKDFGQDMPVLKPRKQYHISVNTAQEYYLFKERCMVDGVVAF